MTTMTSIRSPWPFHQWGIDIIGPFSTAPWGLKFLLVAVDYFTKSIEAETLATVTGRQMIIYMWKNILTRFGALKVLISDNHTHFEGSPFKEWCKEKRIHRRTPTGEWLD